MLTEVVNGITKLTADSGKVLKCGDSQGTEVWLAPTAKAADWVEVDPNVEIDPEQAAVELPKVQAELDRYKAAVAEATAVSPLALKADLVSALTRLKTATAEIKVAEPIVKEI